MNHPTAHTAHAGAHHHGDHHGHDHHDDHADHGSLKSYMTGFVLAAVLTIIPFWLVMGNVFTNSSTAGIAILALAAVQVVVHMVYFLHMNTKSEGGWNMLALVFTVLIVAIMLAGSIWVMYHMNANMMPGMHSSSMPSM
ncbi:cytochrome o ubiquinol oxidase subunit IV [Oxalobacteraceae bacterium R-40]|uniref:Cytochrome bo(3) ubiquinol oxidase subunit 4 n=1 Tax=Keguizhuia sedimenti TaxID=3064264 RepID=A0ABU1BL57_9BURK|nr:cytochrome o ubiquinol oxidase subunit IV [Oxalobacteraceae bacterium R-40]